VKSPSIFTIDSIIQAARGPQVHIEREWVPARPLGFVSLTHRIRATWLVFTGKADAVVWPRGQ